eukprot:gene19502-26167_t
MSLRMHSCGLATARFQRAPPVHRSCLPRLKPPACLGSSDSAPPSGDADVQEALSEIMQIQVHKQEAKERLLVDLEARKEKIRKMGEEMNSNFEEESRLDKMRLDLATSVQLAETMEQFRELEEQVQAVRDSLKEDGRQLSNWEDKAMASQNKNLFFQNLYTGSDDPKADGDETSKKPTGRSSHSNAKMHPRNLFNLSQQAVAHIQTAAPSPYSGSKSTVQEAPSATPKKLQLTFKRPNTPKSTSSTSANRPHPAHTAAATPSPYSGSESTPQEKEAPSAMKLLGFTYLATVLFFALIIDVSGAVLNGAVPSIGLDFIYGVLLVALGRGAWSERLGLMNNPSDGSSNGV